MTVRTRDRLLIGAALGSAFLVLIQLVDYGYGRDQGIYDTVARALLAGGVPYRDAWDFKPPGIYFVYAFADILFGARESSIRWLELLTLASLPLAAAQLSRQYLDDPRPGLLGGAFAIITCVQLEFWNTAQPETFGAVLLAWALVCAARAMEPAEGSRANRLSLWFVCGLLTGSAAVLKPTIALGTCASALMGAWLAGRDRQLPVLVRAGGVLGPFAVGAVLPVGACAAYFIHRGAMRDLVEAVFVFAPRYTALAWQRRTLGGLMIQLVRDTFFSFSAFPAIGGLLLLWRPDSHRLRRGIVHLALVLVGLWAGVLAQARIFVYHMTPVIVVVAFAAGWGFWRLWLMTREQRSSALAFGTLLVAIATWKSGAVGVENNYLQRSAMRFWAWTHPAERQAVHDYLYSIVEYPAAENSRAIDWVRRSTSARSTILVYGFTPEIYVAAGRRPASRFVYDVPQRAAWSRDASRAALIADLARSRPEAILLESRDASLNVTGEVTDSYQDATHLFTELAALLNRDYETRGRIGRFHLYHRRDD